MSRIRVLSLALIAIAAVTACNAPTAPGPDALRKTIGAPSFNTDSVDTTRRSGFNPING